MRVFLAGLFALAIGWAQAALIDRGGGMIYDDVLGIAWLADANYAAAELNSGGISVVTSSIPIVAGYTLTEADFRLTPSGYDGAMTWWGAMDWVDRLVYGGYSDWRLPTTVQPDPTCDDHNIANVGQDGGFNCTGSEMGNLFYVGLGGVEWTNIHFHHNSNFDKFSNIASGDYWSSTEFSIAPEQAAWFFFTHRGNQSVAAKDLFHGFAWAVRDGDVLSAPEPGTLALLALGLAGLGYSGRKQ